MEFSNGTRAAISGEEFGAAPTTTNQRHMQEQKSSSPIEHTLTTPTHRDPSAPHHTSTPPHHQPDCPGGGGSRIPGRRFDHRRAEAVSTYALLASHARTSMHGSQDLRVRPMHLGSQAGGPNAANPCLPRGCCRTRTEWKRHSPKPTNQNSQRCKTRLHPFWEWGQLG